MRQRSSARSRGMISEIITVLLVVVVLAALFLAVHPIVTSRRHGWPIDVKQRAQLHSMSTALELFSNEFESYPPSDANDPVGVPYCGALKLAEATMGQDLLGVHSDSVFRADGFDAPVVVALYPDLARAREPERGAHLKARKGPYLRPEIANAYRLVDIYGEGNTGPFDENLFVLCDVYGRKTVGGFRTGMPILYYRADPDGTTHDVNDPDNPENIYDYRDNQMLLNLGVPGEPNAVHPLADPKRFYMNTQSDKIVTQTKPYNTDSFILVSAGPDGLYGTADDICNFDWKYRE